jgi:hypothetical protein
LQQAMGIFDAAFAEVAGVVPSPVS